MGSHFILAKYLAIPWSGPRQDSSVLLWSSVNYGGSITFIHCCWYQLQTKRANALGPGHQLSLKLELLFKAKQYNTFFSNKLVP